jgi:hypothetical protein
MLNLSCHCGRVQLRLQKRPDHINACNCSFCSKSGAHWGNFHPSEVQAEGDTAAYSRADRDEPNAVLHFCPRCGSTTHFTLTPGAVAKFGDSVVGVNMRLANEADLVGVELRFPDGRSWSGEGPFGYVSAPRLIGQDDATIG